MIILSINVHSQVFYQRAKEDKERYQNDMEHYISNLRENGYEELIPRNYQLQMRRDEKKRETAKRLQNLIDHSAERLRNLWFF